MRDLMPIANDAFRLAIEQLEEVQEYVDLDDLLRLLKRLLRNGRNIEQMLDQLESLIGPGSDRRPADATSAFEQGRGRCWQTAGAQGLFRLRPRRRAASSTTSSPPSARTMSDAGRQHRADPEHGQGHDPA